MTDPRIYYSDLLAGDMLSLTLMGAENYYLVCSVSKQELSIWSLAEQEFRRCPNNPAEYLGSRWRVYREGKQFLLKEENSIHHLDLESGDEV